MRTRAVLVSVLAGTFIGTLNNSLANVAVLDVLDEFDVHVGAAAWFVTGYVLGFAVLMPAAGRLVDAVGTRRVYMIGMSCFAAASALVAIAPNYPIAAVARVLQGVANAPVLPTVMVTLAAALPPAERGRAVGIWASVNGAAIAAGPPLGGLVADNFGWRTVFWLDVPLAIGAVVLAAWWLPDSRVRHDRRLDLAGGALLTGGLVSTMVALSQGSAWGWADARTSAFLGAGVVSLGVLWRRSHRVADPFVDLSVLRNRGYAVLAGVAGLQMVVLFAALFCVPLLLVSVFGQSVGRAGGVAFLLPVTMVIAGPSMGALAQRRGARALTGWGAALLGAAAAALALSAATRSLALVVVGLVVLGAGVSAIQSPTTARVADQVHDAHRGVAMGLFHTIRFVAGAMGTAASAAIFTGVTHGVDLQAVNADVLERAFVAAFLAAGAVAVAALALTRLVQDRVATTSPPQPQPA